MRDNPVYYFHFYPSSKAHFFTRQLAQRSIFCIAASFFLRDFLRDFTKRVYYLPSGADTDLFMPTSKIAQEEKIVFSWIGTFHKPEYVENIKFALECFCALREKYDHIYLEIVGDGIYRGPIVAAIQESNDHHIQLKNWIEPEKIPGYLKDIQIGLLPVARDTKFNRAKSPTKLFEYMSMSKPVVASRLGDAAEIIKDGDNGCLADNKEQFITRMRGLIENEALRESLGAQARRTVVQEYSLRVLSKRLYDILKDQCRTSQ